MLFSVILLTLYLSIKGTITTMCKTISEFPYFNASSEQLISRVSQIKYLMSLMWFFWRVPLIVKSLGLPVVDIDLIGT